MKALTLPEDEAEFLTEQYARARVILEYGSGGSTRLAAQSPGKFVISVESDRDWAIAMQAELDAEDLPSPAIVYYVDVGETGAWGRPVNDKAWQRFHRYPLAVWDEPFFRHPDLVFIDGRFRMACFATLCLRISKPVTVLFDDYNDRPKYHAIETLVKPTRKVGRMAQFMLTPGVVTSDATSLLISLFTEATYSNEKVDYSRIFNPGGQ